MVIVAWLGVAVALFAIAMGVSTGMAWLTLVGALTIVLEVLWLQRHRAAVTRRRRASEVARRELQEENDARRARLAHLAERAFASGANTASFPSAADPASAQDNDGPDGHAGLPDPSGLPRIGQITSLDQPSDTRLNDGGP